MCLWVYVNVCVRLFVNDFSFRQNRMACSVYQSQSTCRSHDTGLMRMLAACALAWRMTGKVFCTCNAQLMRFPSHRAFLRQTFTHYIARWQLTTRRATRGGFISPFQTVGPTLVGML